TYVWRRLFRVRSGIAPEGRPPEAVRMGQPVQESHHPVLSARASQPGAAASPWATRLSVPARRFLDYLVGLTLIPAEAVGPFLEGRFDRLHEYANEFEIGNAL